MVTHIPSQPLWFTSQVGPEGAYAADLDNDDDLDILAVHPLNNKYIGLKIHQKLWHDIPRELTSDQMDRSIFATDVDGDGYFDILCANSGDNEVAWFKNNGDQPAIYH